MNTMTMPAARAENPDSRLLSPLATLWQEKRGHIIKVSVIVGLHAGMAYLLHTGMLHKMVTAVTPQVVNVTLVTPPAPEQAPPPKTVQVTQAAPAIAPSPLPLLNIQVENTISAPPAAPRVATEAPAAVVTAAMPAPAAPAAPRTVQGVEYVRAPAPVYPSISKRLGETGVVVFRVLISEKGHAEQVMVQKSSGSANLDEAGRQAVLRSLYKPYLEDGKAVPVFVNVPINFTLS